MYTLSSVAVDEQNRILYVGEANNFRLWRVNLDTNKVYLHAGSTQGSTSGPLASTKFGTISYMRFLNDTLYVLDSFGIRMLNATMSQILVSMGGSYKSFDIYLEKKLGMFTCKDCNSCSVLH